MDIVTSLQHLGLSEKEAQVYLTLIGLGQASAYLIAERSGLKRPTTYVVLTELLHKGVVSRVPRVRKQLFQAEDPEELVAIAKARIDQASKVLPELQAIAKKNSKKPRVFFFEGKHGLEQTLQVGLKKMQGKEVVGFYATADKKTQEEWKNWKEFHELLAHHKISLRGLAPNDPRLEHFRKTDAARGRTIKQISSAEYSPTVSIEMGDDFVKIQDWDNLQAIVIDNPNITKTLRQIFELVWKNA